MPARYPPVQMAVAPNADPPQMPEASDEVIKSYSSLECKDVSRGSARMAPDPGRAAQPACAASKDTALFTPLKQKYEVFEAGVLHPLGQVVMLTPLAGVAVLLLLGMKVAEREGVGLRVFVAVRVVAVSGVESRHLDALGT